MAGAFVLSSLYHVFGVEKLKEIARFALVFSFALLPVAMMPLMLHLHAAAARHQRADDPAFHLGHFGLRHRLHDLRLHRRAPKSGSSTASISSNRLARLEAKHEPQRPRDACRMLIYTGSSPSAPATSATRPSKPITRRSRSLAGIGIPVACFLHGYAGFIFGSVKANALWMTPLMPVIFICSAVVSGTRPVHHQLCISSWRCASGRPSAARTGCLPDGVAQAALRRRLPITCAACRATRSR
ncbi:MAG: polysulfide reductase NrfD [Desulfobacterales bacterium]|nr:polysulfide reductase NrfD [Desulfobacterales bacterium]